MHRAALLLLLSGCLTAEVAPDAGSCAECHGTAESAAPPVALGGGTDLSLIGVGAHAAHVEGPVTGVATACEECHVVPTATGDEGHVDTPWPAEVKWGPLTKTGDLTAEWDRQAMTCSNTYCHGATLSGGLHPAPVWTEDGQGGCGSCHGAPPPPPHDPDPNCERCHGALSPDTHIDGTLQVQMPADCTGCHGTAESIAPPPDSQGNTDPSERGVGAHAAHADIGCATCHVVPASMDAPGHIDAAPAEVVFGGLATANDHTPTFTADLTCSGSYCHSGDGGAYPEPSWVPVADQPPAGCGSCHGDPPGWPHPVDGACGDCHPSASEPTHIDGEIQTELADCTGCHGTVDDLAPPPDTRGDDDPNSRHVGAHGAHADVACETCHVVPERWRDEGHIDAAPAEVVFGGLALADDHTPTFTADLTCSGSYCHTADGGAYPEPSWVPVADQPPAGCGSCHGSPPGWPHPVDGACGDCHPSAFEPTHVDGEIQTEIADCTGCHGTDESLAPPPDTRGDSDTSSRHIGAHAAHTGTAIAAPVACEECHVVPERWRDEDHIDPAPAEVKWGDLAVAGGQPAEWDGVGLTCSGTYCHGDGVTVTGGAHSTPLWTLVDGTQTTCTGCHGMPPPPPHGPSDRCELCHETAGPGSTIAHPELHVDGVLQR